MVRSRTRKVKMQRKWNDIQFRDGAEGVVDAEKFRAKCKKPKFVAECLARYQAWRTGAGEYAFNEEPSKNKPMPLCPKALTIVEEEAIRMLVEYSKIRVVNGKDNRGV